MKNRRDGADQGIPKYHKSIKAANQDWRKELLLNMDGEINPEQESL